MCLIAEHFTSHESIKTELSEIQEKASISGKWKVQKKFDIWIDLKSEHSAPMRNLTKVWKKGTGPSQGDSII